MLMESESISPRSPTGACAACGGAAVTEPATDEAGEPTGGVRVVCDGCGAELGELPGLEPAAEAPPEAEEIVGLPEGDEEQRLSRETSSD